MVFGSIRDSTAIPFGCKGHCKKFRHSLWATPKAAGTPANSSLGIL